MTGLMRLNEALSTFNEDYVTSKTRNVMKKLRSNIEDWMIEALEDDDYEFKLDQSDMKMTLHDGRQLEFKLELDYVESERGDKYNATIDCIRGYPELGDLMKDIVQDLWGPCKLTLRSPGFK